MKKIADNKLILIISTIVVLANALIGHFFAPWGIDLTPLIITTTSSLIIFGTKNIPITWKSIGAYLFIGFNDILIKLYAGGNHDLEGQAWVMLFALIGVAITVLFLLVNIFISNNEKIATKIISFIIFFILIVVHHFLFANLGIGRSY